jgi:hypothetical protein
LRQVPFDRHVVGDAVFWQDEANPGLEPALADQEMMRHKALVVRRTAVLCVQGQQFVQQRRPGPPMADHKQRIVGQGDAIQRTGQQQILQAAQRRVEQGTAHVAGALRQGSQRQAEPMTDQQTPQGRKPAPHPNHARLPRNGRRSVGRSFKTVRHDMLSLNVRLTAPAFSSNLEPTATARYKSRFPKFRQSCPARKMPSRFPQRS